MQQEPLPITTGRAADLLGISDAQFRRIAEAAHLKPVDYVTNPHNPAGALCPVWSPSVVDALRDSPDVATARARRRPRTSADELGQVAALLAPHARRGERPAATLRRVLRSIEKAR